MLRMVYKGNIEKRNWWEEAFNPIYIREIYVDERKFSILLLWRIDAIEGSEEGKETEHYAKNGM